MCIRSSDRGAAPAEVRGDPGQLRVLARPWAEVYIDGELRETTPVGRLLPLAPGKHYVTFRHPHAPDEKRVIKVAAGQTIVLDVTMKIERPARPDAGARGDAADSP